MANEQVAGADDVLAARTVGPRLVRTRVTAELKCYLCGRLAGHVESTGPVPAGYTLLSSVPGPLQTADIGDDWRRVRCPTCGAPVFLDDVRTLRERVEPDPRQLWVNEPRRRRTSRA